MGKKCIPGVICIENMTLFMLFVIVILLWYLYHQLRSQKKDTNVVVVSTPSIQVPERVTQFQLQGVSTRTDVFNDPYSPPLKTNGYFQSNAIDIRGTPGIPMNMPNRGMNSNYSQVGILTRTNGRDDMILPLMGRRNYNGRDKWQYYTMSNTGNINTKLPVSSNGRSCTSDMGCDEINNNDVVYVEGYKNTFIATIYETGTFSYIPYI
jgi:Family of unknown function (DUF5755)